MSTRVFRSAPAARLAIRDHGNRSRIFPRLGRTVYFSSPSARSGHELGGGFAFAGPKAGQTREESLVLESVEREHVSGIPRGFSASQLPPRATNAQLDASKVIREPERRRGSSSRSHAASFERRVTRVRRASRNVSSEIVRDAFFSIRSRLKRAPEPRCLHTP